MKPISRMLSCVPPICDTRVFGPPVSTAPISRAHCLGTQYGCPESAAVVTRSAYVRSTRSKETRSTKKGGRYLAGTFHEDCGWSFPPPLAPATLAHPTYPGIAPPSNSPAKQGPRDEREAPVDLLMRGFAKSLDGIRPGFEVLRRGV